MCGLLLSLPLVLRAERLPVRVFTSADGLASSSVSSVMRDSRGFLWFCTSDGLTRFDGTRFVTYQIGDKDSPPSTSQILETHSGIYWILKNRGLYRFDPSAASINRTPNAERPILNAELMIKGRVTGLLYQDRKGNIWVSGNGLFRLEEKDGKASLEKIELNFPLNPAIQSIFDPICEGQDGSLWIATSWGLVRRLPDGRVIFYRAEGKNVDWLSSVVEDSAGRIWVGRASGVYIIKPESLDELSRPGALMFRELDDLAQLQPRPTMQVRLPEKSGEVFKYADVEGFARDDVMLLYQTADGHIWISAGDGVVEYNGQSFHSYTTAQGLPKGLWNMAEDTSGNLWLGWANGVMRLDRRGLTSYYLGGGLKAPAVLALNESPDGKLYVTSEGFFLSQFDGKDFQTIRPSLPRDASTILTANPLFQDHTGEWWALTEEGLYRFAASQSLSALARQRPLAIYSSRNGLKGDRIAHIFEDSKGDLWVSTFSPHAGLSRWDRATNHFYTFSGAEGFPPDKSVRSFTEDRNGKLWLGFYEGGMARYAEGRFIELTTDDGVPNGSITALHVDRQERLWVACAQSGLSRIDDLNASRPRFVSYTTDNGLASNNVRSLTEDLYGNIYAGTARGVDKLSPDAANVRHYSLKDGLAGDYVNVAFRDRSGALWFGTPGGLSRLMPQPAQQTIAPQTWLGGLRIAGENRPVPALGSKEISNLELTHAQNNLQVDFFAIDFKEGENLRYQYMLDGADKDWGAPTLQRTVNYASLAPGRYRFLVRAVNADGVTSAKPATISFRVLPPMWQRWWFLILALLAFGGVAYAVYRYRLEQLLRVERVRTRIATDLHDDIGASLSRMAILSEVVKAQHAITGEQTDQMLTDIADSARGLVDSMGDIVWSIDPRRDNLRSLVQRLRQFASDVLEPGGIRWELNVPSDLERIEFSPDQRQHLFLIFKEGITNIARYAECSSAWLSLRVNDGKLVGEISDNGRGFDPQTIARTDGQRGGNGLRNMQARAEALGGRLEIQSAPGQGTKLKLTAPMK